MPRKKTKKPRKRVASPERKASRSAAAKKAAATRKRNASRASEASSKAAAKEKRVIWLRGHSRSQKVRSRSVAPRTFPVENWADMQVAKGPMLASWPVGNSIAIASGVLLGAGALIVYDKYKKEKNP